MTVGELLSHVTQRLADSRIPDAHIEAEVLIRHTLGMERDGFFASLAERVPCAPQRETLRLSQRRQGGEPLPYIVARREFYGLDLVVNPQVLIPRQETELLVDCVLEHCARQGLEEGTRIADVGTGSGAIAIAIAARLPRAQLFAIDCDEHALAVASDNRGQHGLTLQIRLLNGDLLSALNAPVDVIVSNPPYIPTPDMASLPVDVKREPARALDGGPDGMDVIRRLLKQAPSFIRSGGCLFVEISPEQLGEVSGLARETFRGAKVAHRLDALALPRVVCIYT